MGLFNDEPATEDRALGNINGIGLKSQRRWPTKRRSPRFASVRRTQDTVQRSAVGSTIKPQNVGKQQARTTRPAGHGGRVIYAQLRKGVAQKRYCFAR